MTVRENVHQLIDTLPADLLDDVLGYLADLQDADDSATPALKAGTGAARTISVREYQRARGV